MQIRTLQRGSDMITMLKERTDAVGFLGSDKRDELSDEEQSNIGYSPFACTELSFALATSPDKAEKLERKLARAEPLIIATSYPRAAINAISGIMGQKLSDMTNLVETIIFRGSIESKPDLIPRADGIFDLVETGNTIRDNNLTIVAGNIGKVTIGAIWRN